MTGGVKSLISVGQGSRSRTQFLFFSYIAVSFAYSDFDKNLAGISEN